ncbi:hypothetical protein NLX83_11360 [Allokutzneria sp. A3M-2-11 16]|uniref:hypothetical protein n=1 Tax=Allokutzneria sp. A3M-2-11 16 TaxID=2962043 RepID=UPI0020B68675|nr:hypothetical protein [Allokutzneria sp. A3M-2-11 16]MCP3799852.1 hypothetical protein [Allokutzneria sp. A3M-2-11 16]
MADQPEPEQVSVARPGRPAAFGCLANVVSVILGALVGTVMTVVAGLLLFLPTTSTVAVHAAPAEIASAGGYPGYAAAVKRTSRFFGGDSDAVWLGHANAGDVTRGHVVEVSPGWGPTTDLRVEWLADKAVLRFSRGAEVSVPVSVFRDTR